MEHRSVVAVSSDVAALDIVSQPSGAAMAKLIVPMDPMNTTAQRVCYILISTRVGGCTDPAIESMRLGSWGVHGFNFHVVHFTLTCFVLRPTQRPILTGSVQITVSPGIKKVTFSRPGKSWNQAWVLESHGNVSSWCDRLFDDLSEWLLDSEALGSHPVFSWICEPLRYGEPRR